MATEGIKQAAKFDNISTGRLSATGVGLTGALLGVGIDTYLGMKSGEAFGTAMLKGVGWGVVGAVAPGPLTAWFVGQGAGAIGMGLMNFSENLDSRYNQSMKMAKPNFQYIDTKQALTMRQAAVQAIQGSKMNARNALGGEAALMHRSKRIY